MGPCGPCGAGFFHDPTTFATVQAAVIELSFPSVQQLDFLLIKHPNLARDRGRAYQRQGRVRLLHTSPQVVRGEVRGSELYQVDVQFDATSLRHACTCPAHKDRGKCKHICALAYELKARGFKSIADLGSDFARGASPKGSSAYHPPVEDEWEDDVRGDEAIEHLLSDNTIPASLKQDLLRQLLIGFNPAGVAPKSGASRQHALALAALAANKPRVRTPVASLRLRYVIARDFLSPGNVHVEIQHAKMTARGLGEFRALRSTVVEAELDETDAMAVALLSDQPETGRPAYGFSARPSKRSMQPVLQRLLLVRLVKEARLWFLQSALGPTPLVFDSAGPWSFQLQVQRKSSKFEVDAFLTRGDERLDCATLDLALAGGFAVSGGALLEVDWHGAQAWGAHFSDSERLVVPVRDLKDLTRVLALAPPALPIAAPGLVEDCVAAPRPVLNVLAPQASFPRLHARVEFEYGQARLQDSSPQVLVHGDRVLRVQRDHASESLAHAQFEAAGGTLRPNGAVEGRATFLREQFPQLARTLIAHGWLIEGEGKKLRTGGTASVAVKSGVDWFDVQAKFQFEGASVELPELLQALERKESIVRLSDGSYGVLPEEWLAQWTNLLALGGVKGQALRIEKSRGFLLDILLAEQANIAVDVQFEKLRSRLAGAKSPKPEHEPPGFGGELRPYQRAGLGWLGYLSEVGMGGCLADDMGLGKTVQLLALILKRRDQAAGPALVVAPKSLLFNWENETRQFAPALQIHRHHGVDRTGKRSALEDADLVLTTYGTLRQDVEHLREIRFDLVILDEAQAIKNASSLSAKATRLIQADQRFALTGTPVENRIEDLLSIFEFLNPGLLRGSQTLRGLLAGPNEVETARLAARALGPFLLRRTKEAVLTELPAKTEQTVNCVLEGAQRREYDALRKHYRTNLLAKVDEVGIEKASMNVLEALLRLRQAACHLALIDPAHGTTQSAKLTTLMEMLEELRSAGHKALVFSQFTSFLALVKPMLDKRGVRYEYLDGQTRDRQERVERFQSDAQVSVFLVSLKAGGVGLNLTAADYVFLLDPWWNPAVERQAIDRTHRIGQTRPVTAYRLVARDTVEEKVLALQEHKRAVADALFEGTGRSLRGFTRDDLDALLT